MRSVAAFRIVWATVCCPRESTTGCQSGHKHNHTRSLLGSASATPRAVFPRLLRLSQHHISKSDYGALIDRRIQDIMDGLTEFPAHLDMNEQGMFMLGYYHQKQALYEKSGRKEG